MCGIAGFFGPARAAELTVTSALSQALAHRGPDGEGVAVIEVAAERRLVLVHRRLSIIDLSESGRQPMRDQASGTVVSYNGEIYNYRALRAELVGAGEQFLSQSDTEVLLRMYARDGLGALDLIQGMFAFALWDAPQRRLILAVDPLGIKPLYWHAGPDGSFAFASEVRALLDAGLVPRKADAAGLESYLTYGAVQGPTTAIAGVHALPAGCYLTVTDKCRIEGPKRYWSPAFAPSKAHSPARARAVEQLGELLDKVGGEHLVSDVPVAAFLSGGVDSSALAAFVSRRTRGLKSFSVTFGEGGWSEASHSREVARRLGLDHTELFLSADDLLANLPRALNAIDQPTLDGTNVYVISRAVRETGIKVALSGQGGDEVFGGYPTFRQVPRALRWRRRLSLLPASGWRAAGAAWNSVRARRRALPDKIGQFLDGPCDALGIYLLLRQVFAPTTRRALFPGGPATTLALPMELESELRTGAEGLDPIDAVSLFELRSYLGQMLLRDGDVMSMAHGLEVRVPFLDRRIVDFVAALPGPMKMESHRPKPLLLDAAEGAVPKSIWNRSKQGFTFPWEEWLRGRLRPFAEKAMNDKGAFDNLGVDSREVRRLWDAFLQRRPGLSWSRVWALIVLREWSRRLRISL